MSHITKIVKDREGEFEKEFCKKGYKYLSLSAYGASNPDFIQSFNRTTILEVLKGVREEVSKIDKPTGCGMTCNVCDMDDGWEETCDCDCHIIDSDKKASKILKLLDTAINEIE